ncbi:iron chelate uptake ABC transporter family permease subunit, partial [Pseudomonas aeruginosa]
MLSGWALGLCAIAGALVITFVLLRFARRHLSTSRLLLAGVALGIFCSALMTWAVYFLPLIHVCRCRRRATVP